MHITAKIESEKLIECLGLNHIKEEIFYAGEEGKVQDFLQQYKYPLYNIRDKSGGGGIFKKEILPDKVLDEIQEYTCFGLLPSLNELDKRNLVLQGDIEINKDMLVRASLSDIKGITLREATLNPEYNLHFNLLKKKEPKINGLKKIIDYIFKHELFDVVVEFTTYNVPAGIKKEEIVIWELRNY